MRVGEVGAVEVGDDDRPKSLRRWSGASRPKKMKPPAGGLQVPQLAGGRHTHLEQEQAQRALERVDEEGVTILHDLRSLQPADEADDDAAKQQT